MIIGAGDAANAIIKEINTSEHISNTVVKCIIDDASEKQGSYIHGIKVTGTRDNILDCRAAGGYVCSDSPNPGEDPLF